MVLPQQSASLLLASVILLLYWTTSSAQSHDSTCSSLPPSYRVKRDLPFRTSEQVTASSWVVKDTLNVVKHVIGRINTKTASAVMKGLTDFTALVPGIRGLVSHFFNIVFASIPQENPLKELRVEFAELNRKLDSLSIQISNLATDVEWFSYTSVYSQDEICILNGWKKFNEFRENSELIQSEEDKLRLAETFTNYYENTAVGSSVSNLYHYLTVSSTSLSGNLNDLLRKKFKCDISEIGKYNLYFSSLLWKGLVLNELYWNLMGFDLSAKEVEQTQMFRNVYKAQISAVESCLSNYEQYMKEDVVEITKALSPDNKTAIADQVKKALDEKYNWYNWVVLVYNTHRGLDLQDLTGIPVGPMTIAVGYTLKQEGSMYDDLQDIASLCFYNKDCENVWEGVQRCMAIWPYIPFKQKVKVTHVIYDENHIDVAEVPKPSHTVSCRWHGSTGRTSMYFSSRESVCNNTCKNDGTCKRLLDSNEWLCECPEDYYGDRCSVKMGFSNIPKINSHHHVPGISTIDIKLKRMEAKLEKKLEEVLKTIKETCPCQ